ncbi:class I adenylate-forming enzyme family protein [Bordetella sp. 02P26C-1]|uniref:class I adenylate-forming enzyme family protein n=1 Tax=Bordetella sp. 02P26C-1 TaxID=2683195 RepID=UPI0013532F86|nr:fatty acid--CoA ligase family protein [Bordetella sp. 02P26C-1]MVW77824.1 AMP-binding protein [Bordetella sp. 02P26C-1]
MSAPALNRLADCLVHWARVRPTQLALSDAKVAWTYAALAERVEDAKAFLCELGLKPGQRVMLVGENSAALATLVLAAGKLDLWAVMENARRAVLEVDAVISLAQPRRVLYVLDASADAAVHAQRHGAVQETRSFGTVAVGKEDHSSMAEPVYPESHRQVAALIYTTGSTGTPKGVMLTHANLLHIGNLMRTLRQVTPSDRVYGVLPITHVMGLSSGLIGTLSSGAHIRLVARFHSQDCLAALAHEHISILQGAPAMFARLMQAAPNGIHAPQLRFIAAGGAPLDPTLQAQAQAVFKLPLHNGYGLTEASATCWTRLEDLDPGTSVGPATPGVELRIRDAAGHDLADGLVGELWLRGPNVMLGYFRAPDITATVLGPDGWFNTQDLARRLPDGRIEITGRSKDLIIRSGFNVSPLEVETALNSHPDVQLSAVFGHTRAGNEEIIAVVEPVSDAQLQEAILRGHLAERLSPYKRPTLILFVTALPVAPNGKVLKPQLLKQLGDLL